MKWAERPLLLRARSGRFCVWHFGVIPPTLIQHISFRPSSLGGPCARLPDSASMAGFNQERSIGSSVGRYAQCVCHAQPLLPVSNRDKWREHSLPTAVSTIPRLLRVIARPIGSAMQSLLCSNGRFTRCPSLWEHGRKVVNYNLEPLCLAEMSSGEKGAILSRPSVNFEPAFSCG
jgi:hypothetical protein